jgi:SPP1 gp7 family putative phage head morphogenesis protein
LADYRADIKLEPMTFEEAMEYFKEKVPMRADEYYKLEDDAKALAFTVSHIASLDMLDGIKKEIVKAIEEGSTLAEFEKNAKDVLAKHGWIGPVPYRADNVFRTNIQTAYMVGRYKQMTDPDVASVRRYWMYDAINDSRVRPTHLAMDGKVYPMNHPVWDEWYPPNGYRCRCSVIALTQEEVRRMGLEVETDMPKFKERPLLPDKGFEANPGKATYQPDLSKYPPDLIEAYQRISGRA